MHVINGERVDGTGDVFVRRSPASGEELLRYRLASADDVRAAVDAAAAAFPAYRRTTPGERAELLLALADRLEARADELAATESAQTGKSIRLASQFDVPGSIDNARFFAGAARQLTGLAAGSYWEGSTSLTRREPIGVVGSIAPWNYPLQMAAWKILPAVAAGNTIVLKASELTPGTSLMLAEAAVEAGFAPGVINVIAGDGPVAGEALVRDERVAMTSFTGSTAVGRRVMALCAAKGSRVHLELGGKAPFVVFDDADVEAAARGAVAGSLINGGQDCTAATRAIVHASVFEDFCTRVGQLMDAVVIGDPADPATDLGSLITPAHRDRVAGFVDRARAAGAQIRCGGYVPAASGTGAAQGTDASGTGAAQGTDASGTGAAQGTDASGTGAGQGTDASGTAAETAYYAPTLITGIGTDAEVWREEIFGPVLTALPFETDDEAIALANDTPYGLAASAWTTTTRRALRAAAEIEAGCVWVNEHIPIVSEMPHGGYKASGFGKDMSQYSFEEYTQVKHVLLDESATAHRPWQDIVFTTPEAKEEQR